MLMLLAQLNKMKKMLQLKKNLNLKMMKNNFSGLQEGMDLKLLDMEESMHLRFGDMEEDSSDIRK